MDTTKAHLPLTTQITRLARAKDEEGEFAWDWSEIAHACFHVARDAARMASLSTAAWERMVAEVMVDEEGDIALGGRRKPLHEDGTPITFDDRIERGEWVIQEEGSNVIRLPKPAR